MNSEAGEKKLDVSASGDGNTGVDGMKLKEEHTTEKGQTTPKKDQREEDKEPKKPSYPKTWCCANPNCKKRKPSGFKRPIIPDDVLFSQPDSSHHGECPICFLPLSLDTEKSVVKSCCTKMICQGCVWMNYVTNYHHDIMKARACPFCREQSSNDKETTNKRRMIRAKAGDRAAIREIGGQYFTKKDYPNAFKYWSKAAKLGDLHAHYQLGCMYSGYCGVQRDDEKKLYHLETAAIGGHPFARHNLACVEGSEGNYERAVKHLIIAAKIGCEDSMKKLWKSFREGHISKEGLDDALRGHQAAIKATENEQRKAGELAFRQSFPKPSQK